MLRVYLAARTARQQEVVEKAYDLENLGIECTSRWRWEDLNKPSDAAAKMDLEDIDRADLFVLLTDGSHRGSGMHVETGYAIALKKKMLLVGERLNVFHHLSTVHQVNDWKECMELLKKWLVHS